MVVCGGFGAGVVVGWVAGGWVAGVAGIGGGVGAGVAGGWVAGIGGGVGAGVAGGRVAGVGVVRGLRRVGDGEGEGADGGATGTGEALVVGTVLDVLAGALVGCGRTAVGVGSVVTTSLAADATVGPPRSPTSSRLTLATAPPPPTVDFGAFASVIVGEELHAGETTASANAIRTAALRRTVCAGWRRDERFTIAPIDVSVHRDQVGRSVDRFAMTGGTRCAPMPFATRGRRNRRRHDRRGAERWRS